MSIKTPVRVVQTHTKAYTVVDADGRLVIPVSDCEDYKEVCEQVADALNAQAEGTFQWAVKEMMANELEKYTYGTEGYTAHYHNGFFWSGHTTEETSYAFELRTEHIDATDWRKVEEA